MVQGGRCEIGKCFPTEVTFKLSGILIQRNGKGSLYQKEETVCAKSLVNKGRLKESPVRRTQRLRNSPVRCGRRAVGSRVLQDLSCCRVLSMLEGPCMENQKTPQGALKAIQVNCFQDSPRGAPVRDRVLIKLLIVFSVSFHPSHTVSP